MFTLDRKADYYYDFHDGFAYYLYTPDPTKKREDYDNVAVCIIDRDGNVTYDSQNDSIRAVLAYGDGYFFAIKHVSTFDIDEWSSGCIDKDGNTLIEFETIIDSQGKEVFSPILGSPANSFGEGFLIVQLEAGCALFNTAGEKVLETPYSIAGTMAYEEHSLMDWTANHSSYTVSDGYFIACKDGSSIPTIFVGIDGSYIGQ